MQAITKRRMTAVAVAGLLGASLARMEAQESGAVAIDADGRVYGPDRTAPPIR